METQQKKEIKEFKKLANPHLKLHQKKEDKKSDDMNTKPEINVYNLD